MLLVLARLAFGGATLEAAPLPLTERPEVAAPVGGWWTEDGVWGRVYASYDDRVTARRLADHANARVPVLAERLGVPAGGLLEIYVAPDQAAFDAIQPGAPPDWADGTAWPLRGLVFLRSPSVRPGTAEPLEQVLDHEIVHVLVGRAFAPRVAPRWLQEGLAQYATGELGPETVDAMGGPMSLAAVTRGFHGDPLEARRAYAASADLLAFVAGRHGEDAVRRLLAEMAAGRELDEGLRAATGAGVAEIEAAWQARWSDPSLWVRALAREELLWGGAAGLFVLGWWKRRARAQRRLQRMAEEERLADEAAAARWEGAFGHPIVH
ncbi:MAG: peptidase MA family metallohydrolase [Myxococcota bacterium]